MEMDEIMTYAYSSDENDFSIERTYPKDSDDDSLGKNLSLNTFEVNHYIQ